jgi:hypothetical protein
MPLAVPSSGDSSISRVFREQLVDRQGPRQHALLLGEKDHVLNVMIVFFEPLVEWMLAKKF